MNNAITTFILIIVTLGLALGVFVYSSSQTSLFEANSSNTKLAEQYSATLQISSSQPAVKIIPSTSGGNPNYAVTYLVNINIPNYQGNLILIPFLLPSQANAGSYDPIIVKHVTSPNDAGYFNIVSLGSQVYTINLDNTIISEVNGQSLQITGTGYEVPNGQTIKFTYVTNSLNVPAEMWVVVNISGSLFRIAYPVFISSAGSIYPLISGSLILQIRIVTINTYRNYSVDIVKYIIYQDH
ncbi:hypothetical protein DFR86_11760 [Acidianus sulfidivorans JP7]|nr:hypothetical protein DFR86_11760 [Acidianus sulfidivorans JP7]